MRILDQLLNKQQGHPVNFHNILFDGEALLFIIDQLINLMGRKVKSDTCDKGTCKKHLFVLKPLRKGLHFSTQQKWSNCPIYNKQTKKFDNPMPLINLDNKQYTPFFILEDEKNFYTENDEKLRISHQRRIKETISKDSLYVPRHARKRQFCSVCKGNYEEYLEHIREEQHKTNLRKNKFNDYIKQLEEKFKPLNQVESPQILTFEFDYDIDKYFSDPTANM